MSKSHRTSYDEATTGRCERALVTLLGDLGPWRERVYLAGGLAPRYLVGQLPAGARAHVGTTDVDLVIGLALDDGISATYRTLQNNLEKAGFTQGQPSFRWSRRVDGILVVVEFLCETDQVDHGHIFRPKGERVGAKLGALNIRGAHLVRDDFVEHTIEGVRLDDGGVSRVAVRVANLLPYAVLKSFAFQERHENKDAYDLIFTILNARDEPVLAGAAAASSPVTGHAHAVEGLDLLEERFANVEQDGPRAYGNFLADVDDEDEKARLRQEAVATVREFIRGFRDGAGLPPL